MVVPLCSMMQCNLYLCWDCTELMLISSSGWQIFVSFLRFLSKSKSCTMKKSGTDDNVILFETVWWPHPGHCISLSSRPISVSIIALFMSNMMPEFCGIGTRSIRSKSWWGSDICGHRVHVCWKKKRYIQNLKTGTTSSNFSMASAASCCSAVLDLPQMRRIKLSRSHFSTL